MSKKTNNRCEIRSRNDSVESTSVANKANVSLFKLINGQKNQQPPALKSSLALWASKPGFSEEAVKLESGKRFGDWYESPREESHLKLNERYKHSASSPAVDIDKEMPKGQQLL